MSVRNTSQLLTIFLFLSLVTSCTGQSYIRHNTVGYTITDQKIALVGSDHNLTGQSCFVVDAGQPDRIVFEREIGADRGQTDTPFKYTLPCDFSDLRREGTYFLRLEDGTRSHPFSIGTGEAYEDVLALIMSFYKSQRCGDTDPLLHAPCHLNDAGAAVDASGGWHDAGDYIKYMLTVSFTTLELLTAVDYALSDNDDALSEDRAPASALRNILDEARIGLDWMLNMTAGYAEGQYYYQVSGAEDHDHWRLPETDDESGVVGNPRTLHAGWGGNLLGRTAATLAMASRLYRSSDPAFAERCLTRAVALFADRHNYEKVQPANPVSFYDENDWRDDMVIGAVALYEATGDPEYAEYARTNLSLLTGSDIGWRSTDYLAFTSGYRADIEPALCRERMQAELEGIKKRSESDPFFLSSGYAWGTTALFTGNAQKALMFYYLTGENTYLNVATAQRDYLLGRNNWGVNFVIGLGPVYPLHAHSQINELSGLHHGGVVGGPANREAWSRSMTNEWAFPDGTVDPDRFKEFQSTAVYYDHPADYYTNEVALDYAAASVFMLLHTIARYDTGGSQN